jgi:hypothetical protein
MSESLSPSSCSSRFHLPSQPSSTAKANDLRVSSSHKSALIRVSSPLDAGSNPRDRLSCSQSGDFEREEEVQLVARFYCFTAPEGKEQKTRSANSSFFSLVSVYGEISY